MFNCRKMSFSCPSIGVQPGMMVKGFQGASVASLDPRVARWLLMRGRCLLVNFSTCKLPGFAHLRGLLCSDDEQAS